MDINVHGRNVEINDWIREYVEKKVGKLERYLPAVSDVRAELTYTPTRSASDPLTTSVPRTLMLPRAGRFRPTMLRSKTDLPVPDPPTIPSTSPRHTSKSRF